MSSIRHEIELRDIKGISIISLDNEIAIIFVLLSKKIDVIVGSK